MSKTRSIQRIVAAQRTLEGGGFVVHRPFPTAVLSDFDPFLLLDEMGPTNYGPGEAKGAPDHPHRGFETVTYMLSGAFAHADSTGRTGRLNPGDVQWMTAGAGVIHSEIPDPDFARQGGLSHGLQLWVNLPARDKMIAPNYQEIPSAGIPLAHSPDGQVTVKVIAGEAFGTHAVIETRTPILYQHYTLQPGASFRQAVPADFNLFAYTLSGAGSFGEDTASKTIAAQQMVIFSADGEAIEARAGNDAPFEFLLIGGRPLREPVARYGPFVMNTQDEIRTAIDDFRNGRMGGPTAHRRAAS
ncbi:MAG: pirin family protein [Janthinobacterium lividum]